MAEQPETDLFDRLNELPDPQPSAQLSAQIRRTIGEHPKPSLVLSRRDRLIVVGLGVTGLLLSLALVFQGKPRASVGDSAWGPTAIWALLLITGLGLTLSRTSPTPGKSQLVAIAALGLGFFAYLGSQAQHWLELTTFLGDSGHLSWAAHCAKFSAFSGVLSSAFIFLVFRKTDPFSPTLSGAAAGVAGGLVGALSVGLACGGAEGLHLWLGHGSGIVALGLAGAWFGRKFLCP